MIRPTSHFLSETFKCQSIGVVLVSPLALAGGILWYRVCLSFLPDICQDVFLEFDHEFSLNFAMVLETLMKMCMTARFFGLFAPKIGKLAKNRGFLIGFIWICSIMKMFIIFFVPAQIVYLGKILFLRFSPISQPIRFHGF